MFPDIRDTRGKYVGLDVTGWAARCPRGTASHVIAGIVPVGLPVSQGHALTKLHLFVIKLLYSLFRRIESSWWRWVQHFMEGMPCFIHREKGKWTSTCVGERVDR